MSKKYDIPSLIENFKNGEKLALARLITLIENNPDIASEVFKPFQDSKHEAYIIGITGSPGVGKSTLTNAIVRYLLGEGKKVGVISVDPTSPFSGGAFLGDRVRMTEICLHPNAYIRSFASRGYAGGLSRCVIDVSMLYEAFGMDFIIIETAGVGQSEFDIYQVAYTIVVVMVPGYGDQIQMEEAGILEIGDVYDVNKKDFGGEEVVAQIDLMLDDATLFQSGWRPPISMTNGLTGEGIEELVQNILDHKEHMELAELIQQKKKIRFTYKLEEDLSYKIETTLNSLISKEELGDISEHIIKEGKFKIFDKINNIFEDLKFEIKK